MFQVQTTGASTVSTRVHATPATSSTRDIGDGPRFDAKGVRRIGLGLLAAQLVGLLVWSNVLADRFSLTRDFSVYHQAWWLIGHGDFDPIDTLQRFPFWQAHGELLMWPLALIGDLWPHPVTMLWLQDLAMVAAEAIALMWLCELAGAGGAGNKKAWFPLLLCCVGIVLLVSDPWIYWSVSFDFHFEIIGLPFVLQAARDLYNHPDGRRMWWWIVLGMACGGVVATYLLCVGVAGIVAGRRWRRGGMKVAAVTLAWVVFLAGVGADQAVYLAGGYGYLAVGARQAAPASLTVTELAGRVLGHPMNAIRVLWDRRVDIYADVSTGGLLGVISPWVLLPALAVVIEGALYGKTYTGFIVPGYQVALLFVLVPVGTVGVLAAIGQRRSWVAVMLAVVVAVNAIVWGAIWFPRTASRWLSVSPGAALVLSSVERHIPLNDELIASQGVAGNLSGRKWMYTINVPGPLPVHTSTVWVIVAPKQGPETVSPPESDAVIAELAGPLHAHLVVHQSGVWVFRWRSAPAMRRLEVPGKVSAVAGWTVAGPAGASRTVGPEAEWRAESLARPGYVVTGDNWQVTKGHYLASVHLSSSVPVRVEAWNVTGARVLAVRTVAPTALPEVVTLSLYLRHLYPQRPYSGVGPFSVLQAPPPPGNDVEIRVWTPGGGPVSVYSLGLRRLPR
jgi:hypothetical protein